MLGFIHVRTTQRLLSEFGFSQAAQRIASQSVIWPDTVRYFDDRYHAQTPLQPSVFPQSPAVATSNFIKLLRCLIEKIHAGNPIERIAWLGCCLHLVQDLAVHQGNTGPEHFWQLLWLWKFPDIAPADVRRAAALSRLFLKAIRTKFGESFWNDLVNEPTAIFKSAPLRRCLLGESDFSWRLFFQFVRSIGHYLWWPKPAKRIRWDIDTTLQSALQ